MVGGWRTSYAAEVEQQRRDLRDLDVAEHCRLQPDHYDHFLGEVLMGDG